MRTGILKSLEKRPVSMEEIEAALNQIKYSLQATGEREISTQVVGEEVMEKLQRLDKVAYVRFASVYRDFKDLIEFRAEIDKLETEKF